DGATPEKLRVRAAGRVLLRLDRGEGRPAMRRGAGAARAALAWADAVLVSDYGRGMVALPPLEAALIGAVRSGVPVVWDPHPRGGTPVPGVALATPNEAEAQQALGLPPGDGTAAALGSAERLRRRWSAGCVCVTRGARGA